MILGNGYQPSSNNHNPAGKQMGIKLALRVERFDAFNSDKDGTARNPEQMVLQWILYVVEHGAEIHFHHDLASAAVPAKVGSA